MTFDDVLLALFHANVGSRALDAVVYEHVFGYPVRRQTGNPKAVSEQIGLSREGEFHSLRR